MLFAGVIAALTGVIVSGFAHAAATGGWHMPQAPALSTALSLGGLAQATLLATYCYWGYYNVAFLGGEVRQPERTIPRSIILSILFVAGFYVLMNLAALPSVHEALEYAIDVSLDNATVRMHLVADIAASAFGRWAGYLIAALIIWTAFASVFSLLLGYSRVPYAAARDGNYFRFLAAVHPRHGIPHRSLVALGLVGAFFCFFSLAQVITMLVITRILLQFSASANWSDSSPHPPPRSPAPISYSSLPAPAARRHGRLRFHALRSAPRSCKRRQRPLRALRRQSLSP